MKPLVLMCLLLVLLGGCTVMTAPQKEWIDLKADRSEQFVKLMNNGQTTRVQEQEWILSQNESWQLWRQKIQNGRAAPEWMAADEKGGAQ